MLGALAIGFSVSQCNNETPTAHSVHEISWLGGATTTLTYDKDRANTRFTSDNPDLVIRLKCNKENVGAWTADATVFGKKLEGSFEVASNENTFSPCVKGVVNPSYDKAAAGHFIDLTEDMLRSRSFWLLKKILPNPPFIR
ncbi:MAG: hypothetical protein WBO35_05065 [Candidatus Saccharimonadales bacterium]